MKALILAAGYGTRLYPLTLNTPKALLKIGKRCLIDFLIEKIKSLEIEDIAVVTNDRFYSAFLEWAKGYPFAIDIINDNTKSPDDRLGAIGDIEFALDKNTAGQDLLVIGADNLFSWDLKGFYEFSCKVQKPVVGLYDVEETRRASRFGVVKLDGAARIVNFEEKPPNPETTLVGTCIYFFPQNSFGLMRQYSSINDDKDTTGQYISWIVKRTDVYGFVFNGLWLDIGHTDALEEARKLFK